MHYQQAYEQWLHAPQVDAATKEELLAIREDAKEVEDRFYRELEFGTAGLRGVIGAGVNRMNQYVVARATQGVAAYLLKIEGAKDRGVAIAYDSRRFSKEFAQTAAEVLAANGIRAYLFEGIRAVPQLSFTVRHLNCIAGIVITASHNPPQYNGYKVYWEDGGQLGPVQAQAVLDEIMTIPWFEAKRQPLEDGIKAGTIQMIGAAVDEAYYKATETLLLEPELLKEKGDTLNIVYTPLYGAGSIPVRELLSRIGIKNVQVVKEQELPNGDFPGLKAPNPEDPNAFTLAFKLADEVKADVILATDPDSDRLGVAVRKHDGTFALLTGNQIGCLLLYRILSVKAQQGVLPENSLAVTTIVSTLMADAIAARFGARMDRVLTGFRFIAEKIQQAEDTKNNTFLFGFEESYGFLAGGFARDKDAICAAMLVAEACISYAQRGMTLYDGMQEMYAAFGFYQEKVQSYTLEGKEGMEKIAAAMQALRQDTPTVIGGKAVLTVQDYQLSKAVTLATGDETVLTLPKSNVLRLLLSDDAWVCVRPSGTEPKLKLYIGASAKDQAAVEAVLNTLYEDINARLEGLLQ